MGYAPQVELDIIGERRNHEAQTSLEALINGNVLPWPLRSDDLKAANVDDGIFYLQKTIRSINVTKLLMTCSASSCTKTTCNTFW
jgi:hypothetical protein